MKSTWKWDDAHPEREEGEVFLCNIGKDMFDSPYGGDLPDMEELDDIGWETKRVGDRAYDINGNRLFDMFPVFVQRQELVDAGIIKPGEKEGA